MRLSSTRSNINKDQSKFMHFSADINLHLQAIFFNEYIINWMSSLVVCNEIWANRP